MSETTTPSGTKTCPRCAEEIKEAAAVCRYCGHEFASPPAVVPSQPVERRRRGPGLGLRILIAVVAIAVGIGGALLWQELTNDEAASVSAYRTTFAEAGFPCEEFEVIADFGDVRSATCVTQPVAAAGGESALLIVTTYSDPPTEAAWIDTRCQGSELGLPQAYVWGDDDVIEVTGYGTDPAALAQQVAGALGGSANLLTCPTS
ncbi:MAG: hypothetical protein MUF83_17615 [Acidimicrobiales bacterium]|jgi:hypothetical protein|nr:hypothetical protein [Acidimicrobiales bacterium]